MSYILCGNPTWETFFKKSPVPTVFTQGVLLGTSLLKQMTEVSLCSLQPIYLSEADTLRGQRRTVSIIPNLNIPIMTNHRSRYCGWRAFVDPSRSIFYALHPFLCLEQPTSRRSTRRPVLPRDLWVGKNNGKPQRKPECGQRQRSWHSCF